MRIWPALAIAALLHAGCVSLTPDQQARLDDWQDLAGRVTAHYGVSDVVFLVGARPSAGGGAVRSGGVMAFPPTMLDPLPAGQSRDFLLAHELAHWVLGHTYVAPPDETTFSLWREEQQARELDANAEAVKILVVGRGWSQRRAFFHAHSYLWSYKRGVDARRFSVPAGHPGDPCVEINDLIERYPGFPDISDGCPSWPELRWARTRARLDAAVSKITEGPP